MTMFGGFLDPRSDPLWAGGLVTALGYFGISTAAARISLARLVQRGLAHRERTGRNAYYTLSDRALELLEDSDERIYSLDQRDEPAAIWTIVWHALPESRKVQRSQFVKSLRFHGFGQLQDGIWVSPRDYVAEVTDLADKLDVGDAIAVFRAEPSADVARGPLLGHLWQLKDVSDRYHRFATHYRRFAEPQRRTEQQAFIACTEVLHSFRSFASLDPELPEKWAGHRSARRQAIETFKAAVELLREPGMAHFRSLTRPDVSALAAGASR